MDRYGVDHLDEIMRHDWRKLAAVSAKLEAVVDHVDGTRLTTSRWSTRSWRRPGMVTYY
jgi:hypothetical protein